MEDLTLHTRPIRLLVAAALAVTVAACTGSEAIDLRRDAAGVSTGEAGAGGGEAGTRLGSTGQAGSGTGAAGVPGTAGAGTAGTGMSSTGSGGHAGTSATGAAGPAATGAAGGSGTGAGGVAGKDAGVGGDASSDGPELTYSSYIGTLLMFRCGGCHFGVSIQGGFSISYANVTARVSAGTSNCSKLDASKRRIVPGNPEASLIYIKTNEATPPAGCGGHMPFAGTSLLPDQQADLRTWILGGAKP